MFPVLILFATLAGMGSNSLMYLYLKYLNTLFKVIESILNIWRKKVFVFVFKYITKVFEISNTFSNTFNKLLLYTLNDVFNSYALNHQARF